jgi:hypothetical protein
MMTVFWRKIFCTCDVGIVCSFSRPQIGDTIDFGRKHYLATEPNGEFHHAGLKIQHPSLKNTWFAVFTSQPTLVQFLFEYKIYHNAPQERDMADS